MGVWSYVRLARGDLIGRKAFADRQYYDEVPQRMLDHIVVWSNPGKTEIGNSARERNSPAWKQVCGGIHGAHVRLWCHHSLDGPLTFDNTKPPHHFDAGTAVQYTWRCLHFAC